MVNKDLVLNIRLPALLLASCVTVGTSPNLSVSSFVKWCKVIAIEEL